MQRLKLGLKSDKDISKTSIFDFGNAVKKVDKVNQLKSIKYRGIKSSKEELKIVEMKLKKTLEEG